MIDKNSLYRKQTNKHYKNIETLVAKDEAGLPPFLLISTRIGIRDGESFREFVICVASICNQYNLT